PNWLASVAAGAFVAGAVSVVAGVVGGAVVWFAAGVSCARWLKPNKRLAQRPRRAARAESFIARLKCFICIPGGGKAGSVLTLPTIFSAQRIRKNRNTFREGRLKTGQFRQKRRSKRQTRDRSGLPVSRRSFGFGLFEGVENFFAMHG